MGDTKIALLGAAERLFSRHGYASVGIRDIADAAGANLASINYYFGSKRALYLEMVRQVMARGGADGPWARLHEVPPDRDAAAAALAAFIRSYLERLFRTDGERSCGALMLWEAVQPSEAVDAVVRDYIAPGYDALIAFMEPLLDPADRANADLFARSVLSMIHHYYIFRPFIERIGDVDPTRAVDAERAADHVARFALRGVGYDESRIDCALAASRRAPETTNGATAATKDQGARP